jgi:hypothetical protein
LVWHFIKKRHEKKEEKTTLPDPRFNDQLVTVLWTT